MCVQIWIELQVFSVRSETVFFCFDLICICILICTIYCATTFAWWIKIFNVVWLYAYLFSSRTQLIKFSASRQRLRSQYRPSPVLLLLLLRLSVAGLETSRPGTNKYWHSADRRPNEVRLRRALVARGSLKPLHDVVALSRRRPVSPVGDVYRRQTWHHFALTAIALGRHADRHASQWQYLSSCFIALAVI